MVDHWLSTPTNGYLGSSYGNAIPDILQTPQASGLADAQLNKLRTDVPLVGAMPADQLNMYSVQTGPDKRAIYIEMAGAVIPVGNTSVGGS